MSQQLTQADIIFPSAHNNINVITSELRRKELSTANRLRSIAQDASFVEGVLDSLDLPAIANERCGSWYLNPARKAGSAYFKSTDGHFGQWLFSLRRLNLHLLKLIDKGHGCIIIDSTRRGKSMPDALSKTIPIWIAVLSRLLFPERPDYHAVRTPEEVVSASERSQIDARLPGLVVDATSLDLDLNKLKTALSRPMRPYWVTPDSTDVGDVDDNTWPVVLCTASSRASAETSNDASYVQGAADDHESWSHGLTAVLFWQHMVELLATSEDELPDKIAELVHAAGSASTGRAMKPVRPTTQLFITSNASILEALSSEITTIVYCAAEPYVTVESYARSQKLQCIHLACTEGKNGSRQLRTELAKLESLHSLQTDAKILCSCPTGRDLAVGIALAVLCRFFSADGSQVQAGLQTVNKTSIKQRLSWIMISMVDAAPSRATLQSVNAYLMS